MNWMNWVYWIYLILCSMCPRRSVVCSSNGGYFLMRFFTYFFMCLIGFSWPSFDELSSLVSFSSYFFSVAVGVFDVYSALSSSLYVFFGTLS